VGFAVVGNAEPDRVGGRLNDRQRKALVRMFREGPDGSKGGLVLVRQLHYRSITRNDHATWLISLRKAH